MKIAKVKIDNNEFVQFSWLKGWKQFTISQNRTTIAQDVSTQQLETGFSFKTTSGKALVLVLREGELEVFHEGKVLATGSVSGMNKEFHVAVYSLYSGATILLVVLIIAIVQIIIGKMPFNLFFLWPLPVIAALYYTGWKAKETGNSRYFVSGMIIGIVLFLFLLKLGIIGIAIGIAYFYNMYKGFISQKYSGMIIEEMKDSQILDEGL